MHADDDRQHDRDHDRGDDHPAGDQQPAGQLVGHRGAVDGQAEVAVDGAGEPVPVADEEVVVQAEPLAQLVEELLRRPRVAREVLRQRVEAGGAEREHQERAGEQHEDRRQDAPDREEEHVVTLRRQRKSSGWNDRCIEHFWRVRRGLGAGSSGGPAAGRRRLDRGGHRRDTAASHRARTHHGPREVPGAVAAGGRRRRGGAGPGVQVVHRRAGQVPGRAGGAQCRETRQVTA